MQAEKTLLVAHPSMFRNRPIAFLVVVLLSLVVVGIPILVAWWLSKRGTTLTVTDRRTILQTGILSKHTSEVMHAHVRNVQVDQSILQRLFGVGRIGISSAGQSGMEIDVDGLPHPSSIKDLIDRHR